MDGTIRDPAVSARSLLTTEALEAAVRLALESIPQNVIRAYIDSLPARLQAVFNNGGARLD